MKYKLQKIIILCFLMCLSLFASIACNQQHTHVFDQKRTIHKYIKVETNCINDGTCYYSCSCGEKGTKTYVYSKATGHNFENYSIYKEATCDNNATEIATCSYPKCNIKDIKEIENSAYGHIFENYISDGNATYLEDGTKTAKCENPNCDKTDTIIDEGSKLVLYHTVKIVYNNENYIDSIIEVEDGETLTTPIDPRKSNYIFTGWYTTSGLYYKYDFSQPVTDDIAIYAGYEIDAVSLTNQISTNYMKSIVKVHNKSYNTFLGIETSSTTGQGSGFCFKISNGYYYILTNCHVAKIYNGYDKQEYTIEDYQGKKYTGYLYSNTISAKYDLACLYFKASSSNVISLEFATSNAEIGDDIISLGAPKGQSNAITFGNVYNYRAVTLSDSDTSRSNVKFDVMCSDAYCNNGSSGGPVLNSKFKVVGVTYAGNSGGYISCAIPIEKVREFLDKYY